MTEWWLRTDRARARPRPPPNLIPFLAMTQANSSEVLRVHVPGGHYDHDADDIALSREGLIVWKSMPNGSRQTVALYAPGQYLRVERVPAGTPPPDGEDFAIA